MTSVQFRPCCSLMKIVLHLYVYIPALYRWWRLMWNNIYFVSVEETLLSRKLWTQTLKYYFHLPHTQILTPVREHNIITCVCSRYGSYTERGRSVSYLLHTLLISSAKDEKEKKSNSSSTSGPDYMKTQTVWRVHSSRLKTGDSHLNDCLWLEEHKRHKSNIYTQNIFSWKLFLCLEFSHFPVCAWVPSVQMSLFNPGANESQTLITFCGSDTEQTLTAVTSSRRQMKGICLDVWN